MVPRDDDYLAPVCHHYGYNNSAPGPGSTLALIDGCTLCNPDKIAYIDELDEEDNVASAWKLQSTPKRGLLRPEVEW